MLCFQDRTFCNASCQTVDCRRRWTQALHEQAERWWNPEGKPDHGGAPVAFAGFHQGCPQYDPPPDPKPWPNK
jgi:hypothetical protein